MRDETKKYAVAIRFGHMERSGGSFERQVEELLRNHGIAFEREDLEQSYGQYDDDRIAHNLIFSEDGLAIVESSFPKHTIYHQVKGRGWVGIHSGIKEPTPMDRLRSEIRFKDWGDDFKRRVLKEPC